MPEISHTTSPAVKRRGLFIVIEGPDYVGKTTLANSMVARWPIDLPDRDVVKLREPGSTALGEKLRSILVDLDGNERPDRATELCLFSASRCQLVHEKLEPLLSAGTDVILDRYWPTTFAYQAVELCGGDRNSALNLIAYMGKKFHWPRPDLWILGQAEEETLRKRQKARVETNKLDPTSDEVTRARVQNYYWLSQPLGLFGGSVFKFVAEADISTVLFAAMVRVSDILSKTV